MRIGRPRGRIADSRILMMCICITWVNRGLSYFSFPSVVLSPDSYDFISPHIFDLTKVSFLGHSLRPWPSALLFSSVGLEFGLIIQLIFSGIAATLLLIEIENLFRGKRICLIILPGILLATSSADFISWDLLVNVQSLTNSLILLFFTFLMRYVKHSDPGSFFGAMVCGLLVSVQRPILFIVTGTLIIIFIMQSRSKLKYYAIVSFFILTSIVVIIPSYNQNSYWPATYSGTSVIAHLKETSPINKAFRNYLQKQDVPPCLLELNTGSLWPEEQDFCQPALDWTRKNAVHSLSGFLISHPKGAFDLFAYSFFGVATNSSSHYTSAVSVFPPALDSLFIGTRDPNAAGNSLSTSDIKYYLFVPLYLLVAGYVYLRLTVRRRLHSNLSRCLDIIILTNFISMLSTSLLLSSEWTRILQPNSLIFLVSVLLSIAIGLYSLDSFRKDSSCVLMEKP